MGVFQMASTAYKQDLPPKGGYAPINFGGLFGTMAYGYWSYKKGMRAWNKEQIEMKSASLAIEPLMLAERDREFLKQLRRNRDAEEKLMKDVEGWEVGTFYGHKVYKTIGDDLPLISFDEFYIHTNRAEINKAQAKTRWLKMD